MISVVMAVYNGEKYIKEQLDSLRDQTLKPDEVLIFDDRSTDNTFSFVKKYISKYNLQNWEIYLNKTNKGYSRNFSDAIRCAKGNIIFLADQDDIWHVDKIEKMKCIMEENCDILLLVSNVHPFYVGENPQKVNLEKVYSRKDVIKIRDIYKWIKPMRPGCSMCFRKELIQDYDKVWFENYPHDCLLWGLAVLSQNAWLYNRETIEFRRHDTNASSRGMHRKDYRMEMIGNEMEIMKRMRDYYGSLGSKEKVSIIEKQLELYKKREKYICTRNISKALMLLPKIRLYGRKRFWLTDVYYCTK